MTTRIEDGSINKRLISLMENLHGLSPASQLKNKQYIDALSKLPNIPSDRRVYDYLCLVLSEFLIAGDPLLVADNKKLILALERNMNAMDAPGATSNKPSTRK